MKDVDIKEGGVWKLVAITLLSSAITGISSWALFGISRVSKGDMENFVDEKIKISSLEKDKQIQPIITKLEVISEKIEYWMKDTTARLDRMEKANGKSN